MGSAKYLFLENALKKLPNIFSKYFFYLKVQSFRLIMENNFNQMAASAGHAVAYTIGPIFKHIIALNTSLKKTLDGEPNSLSFLCADWVPDII